MDVNTQNESKTFGNGCKHLETMFVFNIDATVQNGCKIFINNILTGIHVDIQNKCKCSEHLYQYEYLHLCQMTILFFDIFINLNISIYTKLEHCPSAFAAFAPF